MKTFFITTFFTLFLVGFSPIVLGLFTSQVSRFVELPKNQVSTTFESFKNGLPPGILHDLLPNNQNQNSGSKNQSQQTDTVKNQSSKILDSKTQSEPQNTNMQNPNGQDPNAQNGQSFASQKRSKTTTNPNHPAYNTETKKTDFSDPKVMSAIMQIIFLIGSTAVLAPIWEEFSFRLMLGKNPNFGLLSFDLLKIFSKKNSKNLDLDQNAGDKNTLSGLSSKIATQKSGNKKKNTLIQSEILYKIGIFSFLVFIGKIIFDLSWFSIGSFSNIGFLSVNNLVWIGYVTILVFVIFYFLDTPEWNYFRNWHRQNQLLVYFFTVLIFALIHTANQSFNLFHPIYLMLNLPQFFAGLAFGFFRIKYGFGWAVWSHCLHNFCLILIFLLS